jgi:hypothetical protein
VRLGDIAIAELRRDEDELTVNRKLDRKMTGGEGFGGC